MDHCLGPIQSCDLASRSYCRFGRNQKSSGMKPDGEKFHSAAGIAEASEPRAHFIAGDTYVPNVLGAEQILPKKVTAG